MRIFALTLSAFLLAVFSVTEAQTPSSGKASVGKRLFHSPAIGKNGLSCNHCHADFDEQKKNDGRIRAGHSLYNSARRDTWWGKDPEAEDHFPNIAAAAVVCVVHYMRNLDKLTAQQLLDLQRYLESITKRPKSSPQNVSPAADKTGRYDGYGEGNKFRGRTLFYNACSSCHPNGNQGIAPAIPRDKEPSFYAKKVREGDGLGAVLSGLDPDAYSFASGMFMPFFGSDQLSKEEIRDIIAYIKGLPPPK